MNADFGLGEYGRGKLGGVAGYDPADLYAWRFCSNDLWYEP